MHAQLGGGLASLSLPYELDSSFRDGAFSALLIAHRLMRTRPALTPRAQQDRVGNSTFLTSRLVEQSPLFEPKLTSLGGGKISAFDPGGHWHDDRLRAIVRHFPLAACSKNARLLVIAQAWSLGPSGGE
jgi:hypothetical protein